MPPLKALRNVKVCTLAGNELAACILSQQCCLLFHLPFVDLTRLPPLEAMRKLYTLENVEGVHWRDATYKAAKLSEPLAALLDTMLEPDTAKRASLEDVCASPWVNMALPPKLQVRLLMVDACKRVGYG
jgi:hypothetical protein